MKTACLHIEEVKDCEAVVVRGKNTAVIVVTGNRTFVAFCASVVVCLCVVIFVVVCVVVVDVVLCAVVVVVSVVLCVVVCAVVVCIVVRAGVVGVIDGSIVVVVIVLVVDVGKLRSPLQLRVRMALELSTIIINVV